MRTASTKLAKDEYDQLKDYAEGQGSSVSEILREFVQGLTDGRVEARATKVKIKAIGGKDICPRCGHNLHLVQGDDSSKLYFICLNCDWATYVGYYKLPKQIEDYKKIKEVS